MPEWAARYQRGAQTPPMVRPSRIPRDLRSSEVCRTRRPTLTVRMTATVPHRTDQVSASRSLYEAGYALATVTPPAICSGAHCHGISIVFQR
jgi:hypothetical protein